MQEINDFMRNESNEGSELKIESDIDNNIDTHIDSNIDNDSSNELYINNEMKENSNKHYNIFDTENKFNDIFLENQKSNTINILQRNNNYNIILAIKIIVIFSIVIRTLTEKTTI